MRIATAGSCFAQLIGRQFKARGYGYVDVEPPLETITPQTQTQFGLGMYAGRYGDVYSVRQLVQMVARADGRITPVEDAWTDADGHAFDPFRPNIKPGGFASVDAMQRDRAYHLAQVNGMLAQTDIFVFTFGLTDALKCIADGAVLPNCPGTIAGRFDDSKDQFKNVTHAEVLAVAKVFIAHARGINPDMKFLFIVLLVPLTATATQNHVLPAMIYSKSVLRAVCEEIYDHDDHVGDFPSFELVSSHPMRAMYFEPNLRSVASAGVANVIDVFFGAPGNTGGKGPAGKRRRAKAPRV